jgi:hypothetical protein
MRWVLFWWLLSPSGEPLLAGVEHGARASDECALSAQMLAERLVGDGREFTYRCVDARLLRSKMIEPR